MYKVKICGITNRGDLELVAQLGADYGGALIDLEYSPRSHSLESAVSIFEHPPLPLVTLTFNKNVEENKRVVDALHPVALQLHGEEPPEVVKELKQRCDCEIWKVIHLPFSEKGEPVDTAPIVEHIEDYIRAGTNTFLFDAAGMVKGQMKFGGTGMTVNWEIVRSLKDIIDRPVLLAGGIKPDNVVEALRAVKPYGVDLSSGVERTTGKKNPELVKQLIENVRQG